MTGSEKRLAALQRIQGYVCKDRQQSYGDAEDNFRTIAEYWNIYLRGKSGITCDLLKSADVAAMMALMKIARLHTSPEKLDNWDDLAGYAVCGAGIMDKGEKAKLEDIPIKKVLQVDCKICGTSKEHGSTCPNCSK